MSSTTEIQAKFDEVKKKGLDLGSKVGQEQDASSGGRVQIYQKGRIYWHNNTGAHEVHGGILKKYLEQGGPGLHPATGRRHFGYPTSDEILTLDGLYPVSHFEFGDIIFISGSDGGVTIHGEFFQSWKNQSAEIGRLQYPLTEPISVAGGEAVYFERGCLWKGPATNNEIITGTIHPPLLGKPELIKLTTGEVRNVLLARWHGLKKDLMDRIVQTRPSLFSDIWQERLLIKSVEKRKVNHIEIGLLIQDTDVNETATSVNVSLRMRLPTTAPTTPKDRTLYDLAIRLPNNKTMVMAPHAFYLAMDWENFGFIHVTDIHVAKRIEKLHKKLHLLAKQNQQLMLAAEQFNNFNDNFRDFIRYANHLHDLGLLDIILATGDLVDYVFESGDRQSFRGGNYAFFEKLIRGQSNSSNQVESEELCVPIFTVFGNHDYRINPYSLIFDIDLPVAEDFTVRMYSAYNLTESEAIALDGKKPTVSVDEAFAMVEIDIFNQTRSYDYYLKRINGQSSYTVALGKHRIVMLDSQSDAGLPSNTNLETIISLAWNFMVDDLAEDTKQGVNGSPNLIGLTREDVLKVQTALSEAGQSGLVIVGIHAPPLNIAGTELAHYFRETEHPTVDRQEVDAFLARHEASKPSTDWPRNGTKHFKTGSIENLLDYGIARGETNAFLQTCVGVNVSRPVDIVLCGHNHDRVEYRIKWDDSQQQLLFFTDFYLENPTTYYPSKKNRIDDKVHLRVNDTAVINGEVREITDHRFEPPLRFNQLDIPPYTDPLDKVEEVKPLKAAWMMRHRPLIVETAALGPIDSNQRINGSTKPSTSFQGFRYFGVKLDVIHESHYVALSELRRHNFRMPWEGRNVVVTDRPKPVPTPKPDPGPSPAPNPGPVVID